MTCRPYASTDLHATRDVFRAAVTINASEHYTPDQIALWITGADDVHAWQEMMERAALGLVVEDDGGVYAFATLEPDGTVHMLMCHPRKARTGAAGMLLDTLEAHARTQGFTALYTQASLGARPVFERHGFHEVEARTVKGLRCFAMEKSLSAIAPSVPDSR